MSRAAEALSDALSPQRVVNPTGCGVCCEDLVFEVTPESAGSDCQPAQLGGVRVMLKAAG
jgi:hypothetical protein